MVNTITTVSLTEKAMLISLNVGAWTARKYDAKVTEKINTKYNAGTDAGRYNKVLIVGEHLKAIGQLDNQIRTFHYERTLPWGDNNQRVILNKGYAEYSDTMRKWKEERSKLIYELISAFPGYVEDAKVRLGRMFNQNDYPNQNEIERKFYFDFSVMPIPSSDDFRVSLNAGEVDRIRQDIERRIQQSISGAMRDLFARLQKVVSHMVEKLGDKKGIFRDSLVENVCELMNILPALDLVDDPEFDKIKADIEEKLCKFSAADLREDPKARKVVAKDAAVVLSDIESAMSAYMGN